MVPEKNNNVSRRFVNITKSGEKAMKTKKSNKDLVSKWVEKERISKIGFDDISTLNKE